MYLEYSAASLKVRMSKMLAITLGILSLFLHFPSEVNCFQRFAEQPKYTEVNPGQDALLTCKIIDKRGTCSWQKDNKPVGIYPKKYEWAGSSSIIHQSMQPPHIGGDCSLWVRSATLDFDDGFWECQVTASDFTTQDALTSQPVRLVVRVSPQRPRLEHEGVHVPPGHNVTVDSGAIATVKCISHYGNPPASLRWFLGDQEISPLGPQINSTEPDNPKTWSAGSVVQVPATRERHGEILKCLAFHESYAAKSVSVEARMDVKYAPTIRLLGAPEIDLEEGKDTLILRCEADANPPASIVWRRAGRSEIASLQESLQLRPVSRRDAGLYTCQAQNSVGTSEQLSIQLDVKYPPRILSAGPDRLTTAPLFSPAAFECVAEGNPPPTYKWVQRISQGTKYLERGHDSRLVIDNVTYDFQGEYECRATNFINGQERTVSSEPISLQVVGAPQVLRLNPSMHSVSVKKGESASLSLVVCADPRPHHVAWEWGSLRLEAGAGVDRYRADEVIQDSREDCYLATLHITRADENDARPYYLVVENERGTDRHAIHLSVEGTFSEPIEMSYLLGIAGGCFAAIFILICLCIYAVRAKKCCFKGRSGYKSSDKDSEKADLKSRSDSTTGPPGDSIYTTPAGFHHHHHHPTGHHGSPEAMKSTTSQNNLPWQQHQRKLHRPNQYQPISTLSSAAGGTFYGTSKLGSSPYQRDLFTGDLGIPEIKTRVGTVVHTFETMARMKREAERPYDEEEDFPDFYRLCTNNPADTSTASIATNIAVTNETIAANSTPAVVIVQSATLNGNETNFIPTIGRNHKNNNIHFINAITDTSFPDSTIPRNNPNNSITNDNSESGHLWDGIDYCCEFPSQRQTNTKRNAENFINDNVFMEDDYRKNLFGNQPKKRTLRSTEMKASEVKKPFTAAKDTRGHRLDMLHSIRRTRCHQEEDEIVNKAFNGIFMDHEGDDENVIHSVDDNDDSTNRNIIYGGERASNSHLEFQKCASRDGHNTYSNSVISVNSIKSKNSSNTIFNSSAKFPERQFNSMSNSRVVDGSQIVQNGQLKKPFFQSSQHYSRNEGAITKDAALRRGDDNENFLRGSTVSKSFIKNIKLSRRTNTNNIRRSMDNGSTNANFPCHTNENCERRIKPNSTNDLKACENFIQDKDVENGKDVDKTFLHQYTRSGSPSFTRGVHKRNFPTANKGNHPKKIRSSPCHNDGYETAIIMSPEERSKSLRNFQTGCDYYKAEEKNNVNNADGDEGDDICDDPPEKSIHKNQAIYAMNVCSKRSNCYDSNHNKTDLNKIGTRENFGKLYVESKNGRTSEVAMNSNSNNSSMKSNIRSHINNAINVDDRNRDKDTFDDLLSLRTGNFNPNTIDKAEI